MISHLGVGGEDNRDWRQRRSSQVWVVLNCGPGGVLQQLRQDVVQRHLNVGEAGVCVSRNPDDPFLQQNRESILLLWNFSPTLTSFNFVHLKVGQCPYFSSQRSVTKEAQLKSLCESKTIITIITIITTITTME